MPKLQLVALHAVRHPEHGVVLLELRQPHRLELVRPVVGRGQTERSGREAGRDLDVARAEAQARGVTRQAHKHS